MKTSAHEEEKFQKQMVPAAVIVEEEEEEIRRPAYFSDLTDKQVTILFCKGPLFRFELCSVVVQYGYFSRQPMLYGFIRSAESPVGPDGFLEVFNRKDNDPLVVPNSGCALLRDCFCSVPVSSPLLIHAQLYVKLGDDDLHTDDDDDDDAYPNEVVTTDNDDDDDDEEEEEEVLEDPFTYHSLLAISKDDAERSRMNELLEKMLKGSFYEPKVKVEEVRNDDEPFEVCNEYINISDYLARRHNGGIESCKTKGKDGSLDLYYVALKNTVDAYVEVEFVATSFKETKVSGWVTTCYGKGFDYGCGEQHLYGLMLLQRKPDDAFVIKPGKLNLTRSVLPVPAQFSLIISAYFRDNNTEYGPRILDGSNEFLVPCDGSSSVGSIVGNDCSINLKVDWKLPFDHMLWI